MSFFPAEASSSGQESVAFLPGLTKPSQVDISQITLSGFLFACTNNEIYDVTAGGEGPFTPETGVGVVTSDFWTWRNFQNAAGS